MPRNESNINEALMNESWLDMKSILDKQMPVKKDRRLIFFIWFLLGASLLTATALLFNQYQSNTTKEDSTGLIAQEVNNNETQNSSKENSQTLVNESTTTSLDTDEISSEPIAINETAQNSKQTDVSKNLKQENASRPEYNRDAVPKSITLIETEQILNTTQETLQEADQKSKQEIVLRDKESTDEEIVFDDHSTIKESNEEKAASSQSLNSNDKSETEEIVSEDFQTNNVVQETEPPVQPEEEVIQLEETVKFASYFDFNAGLLASVQTNTEYYGYGVSLGLDYHFSKRFYVLSSASLQCYENRTYQTYDEVLMDVGAGQEDTSGSGSGLGTVDLDLSDFQYEKYTTTNINLALGFKASRNISLWSGITWRGIHSGPPTDFDLVFNPAISVNTISYKQEKQFINPIFGLRWQPFSRLIIEGSFELGSKDLFSQVPKAESTKAVSYSHLKLAYRF